MAVPALACRPLDDVAALEAIVARDGLVVVGAQGQPRLSGAMAEIRPGPIGGVETVGELRLSAADGEPPTASSQRAQHAAHTRWAAR